MSSTETSRISRLERLQRKLPTRGHKTMENKQYKIDDAVKTVEDKRKSEHKGWFDSWNDRY